jgi:hypothetical protein
MAIITLAEYKALAGISGTAQDTQISALIPEVQADFIQMNNFAFGTDLDPVVESWPTGSKTAVSRIITWLLNNTAAVSEFKSESIGGFSYTKEDLGQSGYPVSLEKGATKWKRISAPMAQATTQYRDRRYMPAEHIVNIEPSLSIPGIPIEED